MFTEVDPEANFGASVNSVVHRHREAISLWSAKFVGAGIGSSKLGVALQ